jgi:predicted GH43/DUF377 family glycosyl hydrolase
MQWRKLGHIFAPDGSIPWMKSHAALPIADHLENDVFKIYFTSRDNENRSHTNYLIVDIHQPGRLLDISREPVLAPGPLGAFDDSGAMACSIYRSGKSRYLYYAGWNLGVTVPYRNSVGLAISQDDGKTFKKYAAGPILDRTPKEPYFTGTTCVIKDEATFRAWYQSCTKWEASNGKPQHFYHIKYAESSDGMNWKRDGQVAIDFRDTGEYAICCPRVIREDDVYKMWYCYRGNSYRIGYAESRDALGWHRKDNAVGIDVSDSGWDSEMICYPDVFDHAGRRYMLYNGNGYGLSGFGLAELVSDES